MFDAVLRFLADEVNAFMLRRTGDSEQVRMVPSRLVNEQGNPVVADGSLAISLFQIEEERALREPLPERVVQQGRELQRPPPLRLNLLVVVAARVAAYDVALARLALAVRCFHAKPVHTPADSPGLPPGLASQHFHDGVQVGSVLRVKAPAGQFFIDPEDDTPAVLIAGGIGITPLLCMLKTCLLRKPQRALHLFYGVRNGSEQAFRPALQQLAAQHPALRLTVAYSRPAEHERQGRDYQHRGHLDVALLQRSLGAGRHLYYLCGPPAMMQSLVPALLASGVPQQDLHYEAFGPATVPAAAVTAASASASTRSEPLELRFQLSGRTLLWDGRDASLLDFAERQGVALESACRSGGCGTCETRVLQGEVVYAQRPMHEIAPGHCLLCVGRPATALVLEA
ncbi:MAG: DUF4255 domain-containing protein [Burkholderiales bacterium]|nr:DUF4255 domain-containing protein [Burkholderiales bacterium]